MATGKGVARVRRCVDSFADEPTIRRVGTLPHLPALTSRLVPDAHLAALAIEHGLTLCSTDGDFAKFPGLKWHNPLAAG